MIKSKKFKEEYEQVSQQLSTDEVIKSREKYAKVAKRFSYLEKIIKLFDKRDNYFKAKEHLSDVVSDTKEDQEMRSLAKEELEKLVIKIEKNEKQIEDKIFSSDIPDHDLIIEIRSASGGEESALFAASLFGMYSKYAEKNHWKKEILSSSSTGIGGFKEVMFSVKGKDAYRRLKFESGVHRVQRVPITESGGRIHTSTVTSSID